MAKDFLKEVIGKNIRILRKQKGQTLQSLSRQIGITHQQLSRIENGAGTSTSTLERIAAILDVDMEILFNEPDATLQLFVDQDAIRIKREIINNETNTILEVTKYRCTDLADAVDKFEKLQKADKLLYRIISKKEEYEFLDYDNWQNDISYMFSIGNITIKCSLMYIERIALQTYRLI